MITRNCSVLVVDDSDVVRNFVRANLQQFGCVVVVARDGKEAVQAAKEAKFDLILMDIFMPKMDGITAVQTIRASEKKEGIIGPIIYAMSSAADLYELTAAGFDGFICKPINTEDLRKLVSGCASGELLIQTYN